MAPACARATARLTLTVDLPTPPLPDATAMMFFTPGTSCSAWRGWARRTMAPQVISTWSTPIPERTDLVLPSISSLSGQAGVVSSIVKATASPSMTIDFTMSSVTMSRPSSGSWTLRRASRTAPSVMTVMRAMRPRSDTGNVDIVPRFTSTGPRARIHPPRDCEGRTHRAVRRANIARDPPIR